jgi:calcium/calmodulin-dependent protein kinase I
MHIFIGFKVLGCGTSSRVTKALDLQSGAHLAVKIIQRGDAQRESFAFMEALILERLHHPNIVLFRDYEEDDQRMYIFLEVQHSSLQNTGVHCLT